MQQTSKSFRYLQGGQAASSSVSKALTAGLKLLTLSHTYRAAAQQRAEQRLFLEWHQQANTTGCSTLFPFKYTFGYVLSHSPIYWGKWAHQIPPFNGILRQINFILSYFKSLPDGKMIVGGKIRWSFGKTRIIVQLEVIHLSALSFLFGSGSNTPWKHVQTKTCHWC